MEFLQIAEVIVACLLIIAVLLQNRGGGLSGIFGGQDSVYSVKRGAEKIIFIATIILSVMFFGLSLIGFLL